MKKDYVEVVYNNIDRPLTNYPNKLTKYLFDKYDLKKEDKLLEIGCGRGEFLQGFVNLGIKGFGRVKVRIPRRKPAVGRRVHRGFT